MRVCDLKSISRCSWFRHGVQKRCSLCHADAEQRFEKQRCIIPIFHRCASRCVRFCSAYLHCIKDYAPVFHRYLLCLHTSMLLNCVPWFLYSMMVHQKPQTPHAWFWYRLGNRSMRRISLRPCGVLGMYQFSTIMQIYSHVEWALCVFFFCG